MSGRRVAQDERRAGVSSLATAGEHLPSSIAACLDVLSRRVGAVGATDGGASGPGVVAVAVVAAAVVAVPWAVPRPAAFQ